MRSASLVDFDGDVAGDGAGEAGAGMGGRATLNGDVGVAAGAGGATDLVGDATQTRTPNARLSSPSPTHVSK